MGIIWSDPPYKKAYFFYLLEALIFDVPHPLRLNPTSLPYLIKTERSCISLGDANREVKHAGFWDADGNRKRTFHVLGKHYLLDFHTPHF